MPLSSESLQPLLMIAGMGVMCWILLRGKMRRGRKSELPVQTKSLKHNGNAQARMHEQFTGTASLGAPAEVLKWQVELHDLGRELKAELDSKMIAVRSLTRSYDQAARRLSELIRLAEQLQVAPGSPLAQVRRLSAEGWSHERISQTLGVPAADVALLLDHGISEQA